jgi:hypothetical protein
MFRIPFRTIRRKDKFCSEPIIFGSLIQTIHGKEFFKEKKNTGMTFIKNYSEPFRSVPKLAMDYSETPRIPRKEHFFPQNNENCSRKFFSERNFDGNPSPTQSWRLALNSGKNISPYNTG